MTALAGWLRASHKPHLEWLLLLCTLISKLCFPGRVRGGLLSSLPHRGGSCAAALMQPPNHPQCVCSCIMLLLTHGMLSSACCAPCCCCWACNPSQTLRTEATLFPLADASACAAEQTLQIPSGLTYIC